MRLTGYLLIFFSITKGFSFSLATNVGFRYNIFWKKGSYIVRCKQSKKMEFLITLIALIFVIWVIRNSERKRTQISIRNEYEEAAKERTKKIEELKEKYKNLTPEDLIFTEELSKECIPSPSTLTIENGDISSYSINYEYGDDVIQTLLQEIHGFSSEESKALIKSAKKSKQNAKLKALKGNISKKAHEIYGNIPSDSREPIPEDIQVLVWNRDGGKCVKCGSQDKLEFDHIIPVSKGGSNTARNIQLLCEKCNRGKHDKIGS